MTAAGWIEHNEKTDSFELPQEHAYLVASEGTDHFMGGLFLAGPALLSQASQVAQAFRDGGGVPFDAFDADWIEAMDLMNGGAYVHRLASYWMAQLPDVTARLESGGRALDLGCGVGRVSLALAEAYRVLRPGGALGINTCTHRQLTEGCWWSDLIPEAVGKFMKRCPSLERLEAFLGDVGFRIAGRYAPLDEVGQGESYLDPEGPLKASYRDGDSTWRLATARELERAQERVRKMIREGTMERYVRERDAPRKEIGQTTYVFARK